MEADTPIALNDALDVMLVLHDDHKQKCSTAAISHSTSYGADVLSSLSSGVDALYGRLHGAACEKLVNMLERIRPTYKVLNFLQRAEDSIYCAWDSGTMFIRRITHELQFFEELFSSNLSVTLQTLCFAF